MDAQRTTPESVGYVEMVTAVVRVARRDAKNGDRGARAWLAELEACRPRSVRLIGAEQPCVATPAGQRCPSTVGAAPSV